MGVFYSGKPMKTHHIIHSDLVILETETNYEREKRTVYGAV